MDSPKTLSELMSLIHTVFPQAYFGEDNEGQIVIYTDLREGDDGELVKFESE